MVAISYIEHTTTFHLHLLLIFTQEKTEFQMMHGKSFACTHMQFTVTLRLLVRVRASRYVFLTIWFAAK